MTVPEAKDNVLDFSIVIPTYNRPESLRHCLQALTRLDYPKSQVEVVIVDDGGEVNLDGVVAELRGILNIGLIRQDNAGPACARNTGLRAARGTYVAMTDDDCAPAVDWLARFKARFSEHPEVAVAGRATNGLVRNSYSTASQLLVDFLLDYYNSDGSSQRFGTSNNLAFPRQALLDIGGFDESFPLSAAEDRELVDRWVHSGNRLIYDPAIEVRHFHEMNIRGFSRQHLNYGRGAYRYHSLRARNRFGVVEKEPLSFYFNMLRYSYRQELGLFRSSWISLLTAWSQVVNAYGYFKEKWKDRHQPDPSE